MTRKQTTGIVYGWLTVASLMFISSLIITLLIRFVHLSVETMGFVTMLVGLIALFAGGLVGGMKGKENSLMIGAILGLGFTLIILFVQVITFGSFFEIYQFLYHALFILTAIIGAVIGVHLNGKQVEES